MQIFNEIRRYQQPPSGGASEGTRLRRSEMVADIFNNQDSGKAAGEVKLRLSHASRKLGEDLRTRVQDFLKANKDLASDLNNIELPEESRGSPKHLAVRRMGMYLQWLRIREIDETAELSEAEQPLQQLRQHGKDEEMRGLFGEYDAQRKAIREQHQKQAPNYYYMAYPETYSFN